jgi:hypothetical protein
VGYESLQGLSQDASHVLFTAQAPLDEGASTGTNAQTYDRFGGANHLVSVLPDGSAGDPAPGDGKGFAAPSDSAVGGSASGGNLEGAVSADGSRVYWTAGIASFVGSLYLRQHPEQGIAAGECASAAAPCTVPASLGNQAFFWAASADGSKALYSEGFDLLEFDLGRYEAGKKASRLVASEVKGVAGVSEDLARIYFVSAKSLTGTQKNSEGDMAIEGKPNLYLTQASGNSFVATLAGGDVNEDFEPGAADNGYVIPAQDPYYRATRVSADGARIAFQSRAPLSGYDNRGEDGRPAVEVFTYEAGGKQLDCVSCNPSGMRPGGVRELLLPYRPTFEINDPTNVPAAAWIPTWEHPLHASNVLSADGNRLFFNSNDALLPPDNNEAPDVYQWEMAGTGSCEEADSNFFPQNGGCLHLISSGESPSESEFWEASPDGEDVFFTTASSLLPQDPGSIDLYDARVEGGFAQLTEPAACEGEACQSPPEPPNDPTPASSAFQGAGNVAAEEAAKPRPCAKGKVRRKGRCVSKHRKRAHRQRRANHNRGAAR